MAIYITGDTHGDLSLNRINKVKGFEDVEYLIITGDFGYLWDNSKKEKEALDYMEKLNFTILWVCGNHENYNLLNQYDKEIWNGGIIQKIRKNIFRLNRGEIYTINNKTFFTFGGARSIDRYFRKLGASYWLDEIPTEEEKINGLNNLKKFNNKVDYIITHTCSKDTLKELIPYPEEDPTSDYLYLIKNTVDYNKWYFGHLHLDEIINDKERCLYKDIIKL